jgi:hypothetical protein
MIAAQQDIIAAARRGLLKDPTPALQKVYHDIIEQARQEIRQARELLA